MLRYNATDDRTTLFVLRSYFSCVRNARSKHHSHDDVQVIMMHNQAQVGPRPIWLIVIIRFTYADVLRNWTGLMIESLCRCDLNRDLNHVGLHEQWFSSTCSMLIIISGKPSTWWSPNDPDSTYVHVVSWSWVSVPYLCWFYVIWISMISLR